MVKHRIDMHRYQDELDRIKSKNVPENCTLFYGSSTFAHWTKIESDFKDYNAINAGFGGSTSDEAIYHYDDIVKKFNPKILVWYYGDNEPVCGYTFKETTILFKEFFDRFHKDYPNSLIICLETKSSYARKEYYDYVIKLNKWVKKYCLKHYYMEFVESNDVWWKDGDYDLSNFIEDKLHYNDKGNNLLKNKIISVIENKRKLDIIDTDFEKNTEDHKRKLIEQLVSVSVIFIILVLTILFISKPNYWPYLLINIVLTIIYIIYFIYTIRNTLYSTRQKEKILDLMRNSNPSSEYLIYKDMQVEYDYEGIKVALLKFINKENEERYVYCLEEHILYLKIDQLYKVESLNNFIVKVEKIDER